VREGAVTANLARHRELLGEAAAAGCDLALFPEMSLTGSVDPAAHPWRLMPVTDPAVRELAAVTAATGVAACFGVAERAPRGGAYITQVVAAGGRVTGIQRKQHLGQGEEAYAAAGQAGATVDEDFPGLAALVSPAGAVTSRLPDWRPGTLIADVPLP
jgi:predicted amidohydrolase